MELAQKLKDWLNPPAKLIADSAGWPFPSQGKGPKDRPLCAVATTVKNLLVMHVSTNRLQSPRGFCLDGMPTMDCWVEIEEYKMEVRPFNSAIVNRKGF